jgi:hypothetical protein
MYLFINLKNFNYWPAHPKSLRSPILSLLSVKITFMNNWQHIDETRRSKDRFLVFMSKSLLGTQREERLSKREQ